MRSVLLRSLISWGAVLALVAVAIALWMRDPAALLYMLHHHQREIASKQRWLSREIDGASVGQELRRFAAEQRWEHPERRNTDKDFFYQDDPRLPQSVRQLHPSWVQIGDDTIDVGCGEITRDGAHSFGLVVWRDPNMSGHGTRKLGPGIWYYQGDATEP